MDAALLSPCLVFFRDIGLGVLAIRECQTGTDHPCVDVDRLEDIADAQFSERLHSLSLGVEATRREHANDNGAEHGVILNGALRW